MLLRSGFRKVVRTLRVRTTFRTGVPLMLKKWVIALAAVALVLGAAVLAPSADPPEGLPEYRLVADWPRLPEDVRLGPVSAVATDAADRVYVFHRGKRPILVFDTDGKFLRGWGDDGVKTAHGL